MGTKPTGKPREKIDLYEKGAKLAVYALTEWASKDRSGTRFDRIGAASINRDGSLNLYLDLLPAKGQTVQVRVYTPREDKDGSGHESSDRPF